MKGNYLMRKSVIGGNGSQCDMCSIALKPFETFDNDFSFGAET